MFFSFSGGGGRDDNAELEVELNGVRGGFGGSFLLPGEDVVFGDGVECHVGNPCFSVNEPGGRFETF